MLVPNQAPPFLRVFLRDVPGQGVREKAESSVRSRMGARLAVLLTLSLVGCATPVPCECKPIPPDCGYRDSDGTFYIHTWPCEEGEE
jgi:hypothetical protein